MLFAHNLISILNSTTKVVGKLIEQFDVARTYAHELSHGAFALHHTFSENSESFHANEGTTNNLMDYTEHGTTLNHKQWRWMHENHGSGANLHHKNAMKNTAVQQGMTVVAGLYGLPLT